jgi:hypothetical protein
MISFTLAMALAVMLTGFVFFTSGVGVVVVVVDILVRSPRYL